MTGKTITLIAPVEWHNETVRTVELREPTGGLYAELGEPRIAVRTAEGAFYFVEQTGVVRAYLEKCLRHEGGADLLRLMTLADAMQVKEALLGFFTDAAAAISRQRSTPSSSASAASPSTRPSA